MQLKSKYGCLTITTAHTTETTVKRTKPRHRIACNGVCLCAEIAEKSYLKRFSDIEKALVILIEIVQGGSYGLEGGSILDLRGTVPS